MSSSLSCAIRLSAGRSLVLSNDGGYSVNNDIVPLN